MMTTSLIYNFGQTVLDSSKKKQVKSEVKAKDPEETLIIEEYEGQCEQCEIDKPQKLCSICDE